MANIALLSLPQYGHVNPQLPIVAELVRRGHRVTVYNEPRYAAVTEATGARFLPYPVVMSRPELGEALSDGDLVRWLLLLLSATPKLLAATVPALERDRPDVLVFDGIAVWGEIAARRLKVPSVSISTAFIFAALDDPSGKRPPIGRWALSTLKLLPQFIMPWIRMAQYGPGNLPWRMPFIPRQGTLTMVLTSKALHPKTAFFDNPRFAFVGACIEPATRPESFDFSRLDGRPLIYVSLGTVLFTNRRFFESCITAFAGFPGQVLLSVGPGTDLGQFANAPSNFIIAETVPQLDVLQHTAVFVTHAGLNSLHEALWFGVPMVAVPHTPEQARNAFIAGKAGAAIVLDDEATGRAVTADRLRSAVDAVVADPGFRDSARNLGRSLHEAGGFREAADRIEDMAGVVRGRTAPEMADFTY